jgi:Zn-dependent protease
MDFFNQGLPLGRWFGIRVVLHWTFLVFAAFQIIGASQGGRALGPISPTMIALLTMVLLFGTVLLHEFGHALACKAMGGTAERIILWPLGGIAFVQPPMNPWAFFVTTACGPLVNAILWPLFWWLSNYGLPMIENTTSPNTFIYLAVVCEAMTWINKALLLFNLIPAYPMDGGRLLQETLWFIVGYGKSLQIAGMVGSVAGGGLILLGMGFTRIRIPVVDFTLGGQPNMILAFIGFMCMMESFGIYKRSQEIDSWKKN